MKNLSACVLTLLISWIASADVKPNRYDCESDKWKLVYAPDEVTGTASLSLVEGQQPALKGLYRVGKDILREKTPLGVEIQVSLEKASSELIKYYTLIVPAVRFRKLLESTNIEAMLVETTTKTTTQGETAFGQLSQNVYFPLQCKASHAVY